MRASLLPRLFLIPVLLAALAGCDTTAGFGSGSASQFPRDVAPPEPVVTEPSAATRAARDYYARVEANYFAQDLLRADGGGSDTPFTARDLAENFIRIAFYDEFAERDGQLIQQSVENRLHRWQEPIRLDVEFGSSIPADQRARDRAEIAAYVMRLSSLTGLPMRMSGWRPNHSVLILNSDERKTAAARIAALAPATGAAAIRSVTDMAPETYCTVFSFTPGRTATYTRAITVIRGELPERMRLACIHEELAQSLGLVADYPRARPSIFNDNEEFALLTRQDEMMLKMLYDPRLRPGMTLNEARPIVEVMAAELAGGES
ncbi:DUF2927 domain-containing protein [Defluviimonas sp. SAOS-178_SWC]|uniref:DUF2927 domain-containing protein n=1 Tax=Defluviimonas sp. SAOS-178_SWC TaxID=3121287 RepID=UPI003221A640